MQLISEVFARKMIKGHMKFDFGTGVTREQARQVGEVHFIHRHTP